MQWAEEVLFVGKWNRQEVWEDGASLCKVCFKEGDMERNEPIVPFHYGIETRVRILN